MFNIFNKKPKKNDHGFEIAKRDKQIENNKYVLEELRNKYQEELSENPIKILGVLGNRELIKIKRIDNDEKGSGGDIGLSFEKGDEYLHISKDATIKDRIFNNIYKTDQESVHNLTRIMPDLISRSGYNEEKKARMQSKIINHLNELVKKD